jgi:hypothetical protein
MTDLGVQPVHDRARIATHAARLDDRPQRVPGLDDVHMTSCRTHDEAAAGSGSGEGTTTGSSQRAAEDEADDSRGGDERGHSDQPPTTADTR